MNVLILMLVILVKLVSSQETVQFTPGQEMLNFNTVKFLKIVTYFDDTDPFRMQDFLNGVGPNEYTIFAPLNKAFTSVPSQDMENIMETLEMRKEIAKSHIFEGLHRRDELAGKTLTSMNGLAITFSDQDTFQSPDGTVIKVVADAAATHGVVYAIEDIIRAAQETATDPVTP